MVLLGSCNRSPKGPTASVRRLFEPTPRSSEADDAGRFLAGLPVPAGSPWSKFEQQAAWKTHREELEPLWSRLESSSLPMMKEFQKTELTALPSRGEVLFYPFSGPDALTATVFFPHARTYVMVGLEPAGTLPLPRQFEKGDLKGILAQERDTVFSELYRSFFITREMDRQFRGQVTDGLFTPILHLLVRTGHTVLGYRYVRLDERGRVIARAANYKAPGKIGNKGIEIDFRNDADESIHKLFYFSVNLSNHRLKENRPFLTFVSGLKGMTTFLKATSYMTHKPEFSIIRNAILEGSGAVLQDDSGMPYRYYQDTRWLIQLYGHFEEPYGSFRYIKQPDLKKAYDTMNTKPLSFRIGYGYSRVPSNLLLARRR